MESLKVGEKGKKMTYQSEPSVDCDWLQNPLTLQVVETSFTP